ncbi:MAG: transketolase family protein, partial [Afipia sp.]|nr:transketolase family protein [Afipia sp.]
HCFQIGKANLLDDAGTDVAIICNGCAVARVLRAKALWEEAGIRARVIEMPCVKPIDEDAILAAVKDCGRIVTAEEHNVIGGLGSAVCEVVCKAETPCAVTRIGIDDIYTESGPHNELLDKYNLSPEHIADVVKNAVK